MAAKPQQSTPTIKETAVAYQLPPAVALVDKAIADAEALQKAGKTAEASEKWRALANILEGTDDTLAAHAWFKAGTLFSAQALDRSAAPAARYAKAAIAAYDNVIRLEPEHLAAHINRGKAHIACGHYETALIDIEKALCLEPENAAAYTVRGMAKFYLRQPEAALADFEAALRLEPGCAEAYASRGIVKSRIGKYECAMADFDKAIQINPEMLTAYQNRAQLKFSLGHYVSAISDYDAAIRLAPDNAVSYTHRGLAKEQYGKLVGARAPSRPAREAALLKHRKAAQADYDAAIRLAPNYAQPYTYRALEKMRRGHDAAAIADLKTALKLARDAGDTQHEDYVASWLEDLGESGEEDLN